MDSKFTILVLRQGQRNLRASMPNGNVYQQIRNYAKNCQPKKDTLCEKIRLPGCPSAREDVRCYAEEPAYNCNKMPTPCPSFLEVVRDPSRIPIRPKIGCFNYATEACIKAETLRLADR